MKKHLAALLASTLISPAAFAQSNPGLSYRQVLTPAQWNGYFSAKQDVLNYVPLNVAGGTMSGRLVTAPPSAAVAGFNLTCGSAPASPVNGDIWCTSAGVFSQANGVTVGPFIGAGSSTFTGTAPIVPSFPSAGVVNYAITNGTSVANPGTGTLEDILPPQTVTGASKTFATADLFKKTRRSNSGSAMSDTFPASTATGMVNGTRIIYANADATATATITAGAGTVMASGGSTDTIGPGRDVAYEYDLAATQWRRAYNTGTALLGPNNLSDLTNIATARTNLGLGSAAVQNTGTSGANVPLLNGANTWGATQAFPNNSLTLAEFPTIGADTVLGSIAGGTPAALSQAQLTALINPATASLPGALPAWPNNTTTYFRGDGTYPTLNFAAIGGTATGSQLPTPGASSLGGVQSKACTSGQFLLSINTDGTETCSTPVGGGNVSNTGTPVANQIAQWTGSTIVQGVNLASLLTGAGGVTITGTTNPTITSNVASVNNLLPNTQWELFSGTLPSIKQNATGTTSTGGSLVCSSFTTTTQSPLFTCSNTQAAKVGDLAVVEYSGGVNFWGFAGAGYITCAQVQCPSTPMSFPTAARVIAVVANTSLTLASPGFGGVSPASPVTPTVILITPGDSTQSTTRGPDGWQKTQTLTAQADDFPAHAYPGATRVMLLRKGITGQELFFFPVATNQFARYQGKTATCGAAVYQTVQGGAGTWHLILGDSVTSASSSNGTGSSVGGYEYRSVTYTFSQTGIDQGFYISTDGNAGDVMYLALPTCDFVPSMVQSQLGPPRNEIIRATAHWNPPLLTPYIISFPASAIGGYYGYNGIDIEAISLGTVHNTVNSLSSKVEWTTSTVGAQFYTTTNLTTSCCTTFGLQANTQVSGVMFPSVGQMDIAHDGTFGIFTPQSGGFTPTSATFDIWDVYTGGMGNAVN